MIEKVHDVLWKWWTAKSVFASHTIWRSCVMNGLPLMGLFEPLSHFSSWTENNMKSQGFGCSPWFLEESCLSHLALQLEVSWSPTHFQNGSLTVTDLSIWEIGHWLPRIRITIYFSSQICLWDLIPEIFCLHSMADAAVGDVSGLKLHSPCSPFLVIDWRVFVNLGWSNVRLPLPWLRQQCFYLVALCSKIVKMIPEDLCFYWTALLDVSPIQLPDVLPRKELSILSIEQGSSLRMRDYNIESKPFPNLTSDSCHRISTTPSATNHWHHTFNNNDKFSL